MRLNFRKDGHGVRVGIPYFLPYDPSNPRVPTYCMIAMPNMKKANQNNLNLSRGCRYKRALAILDS